MGAGGRAVMMIVLAAVLLAAVGWGVNAIVRRVEQEMQPPAAPSPPPAPGARSPARRPATTSPADELRRQMHEELEKRMAELEASAAQAEAVRAGGEVRPPVAIQSPEPKYTELARRARIQGVVVLEATIDRQGRVVATRVLKGLPMGLDEAAREAVSAWRFEPATRDGEPVPVIMTLTINFKLE